MGERVGEWMSERVGEWVNQRIGVWCESDQVRGGNGSAKGGEEEGEGWQEEWWSVCVNFLCNVRAMSRIIVLPCADAQRDRSIL